MTTTQMNQPPLSPPSDPETSKPATISLDSSIRTTPIHPLLPNVRVPGEPLDTHNYHPVTCVAIDTDEVAPQIAQLRRQYPTREAALKAQEQAASEAREKIEMVERKREEVQEKVDKKVQERDTEMKVLSKYGEVKG